jgi:RNA polymerase sigma factor (sigma-70 family)
MLGCVQTAVVESHRDHLLPTALLRLASDQRLVEHVQGGSERAFEALFDRYHGPVFAFCRHMLGSREEAEDAVQLTFLAAYRDLLRSQAPSSLRPWLYAIARHRCLSMLRARREHPVAEIPELATDHLAAQLATREDLRVTLADVARLPDDQRAALVLAELGDVSHKEIAEILVCPPAKVKALVFQARSSLIAGRAARETPCEEIREQLAILRGSMGRDTTLRRHLRDCPGCQEFRDQLRVQRRALGLLLPVGPALGLRRAVLDAILGSGSGEAGATTLTVGALNGGGLAATALVVLAIPVGGITVAATAFGDHAKASHATRAAPRSAVPRPRAERARSERDRPGSTMLSRAREEPHVHSAQADGGAHAAPAQPANSCGHAEPARRPVAAPEPARGPVAAASVPPTANAQSTPATLRGPDESPANDRTTPAAPARPSKPPPGSGRPTSAAHGRPGEPPGANGRPQRATPAQPSTPAQTNGQTAPAAPSVRADGPLRSPQDDVPGPAVTPEPSATVAAPGGSGWEPSGGASGRAAGSAR